MDEERGLLSRVFGWKHFSDSRWPRDDAGDNVLGPCASLSFYRQIEFASANDVTLELREEGRDLFTGADGIPHSL